TTVLRVEAMRLACPAAPRAARVTAMGLTSLKVRLSNPRDRRLAVEEELLVDFRSHLRRDTRTCPPAIGVRPRGEERFTLIDGTHVTREVGTVFFEMDDREGA